MSSFTDKLRFNNRDETIQVQAILILILIGLFGVLTYPAQIAIPYLHSIGLAITIAISAFACGGLIGFLFGIPRTLQSNKESDSIQYAHNTNLEQISDWLTKIFVGIGLTQLNQIGTKVQSIAKYLAEGFDGSQKSEVFAGALTVYFVILGFMSLYLWARLNLVTAFRRADKDSEKNALIEALTSLDQIEGSIVDDRKKIEFKESVNILELKLKQAVDKNGVDKRLNELALKYESLRNELDSSIHRTREMTKIVREVKALATDAISPKKYYEKNTDGHRIVAIGIVRSNPMSRYADIVISSISSSRSAFEQYHALRAAEEMINSLNLEVMKKLQKEIRNQISEDSSKTINPLNKDRWEISHHILKEIDKIINENS